MKALYLLEAYIDQTIASLFLEMLLNEYNPFLKIFVRGGSNQKISCKLPATHRSCWSNSEVAQNFQGTNFWRDINFFTHSVVDLKHLLSKKN